MHKSIKPLTSTSGRKGSTLAAAVGVAAKVKFVYNTGDSAAPSAQRDCSVAALGMERTQDWNVSCEVMKHLKHTVSKCVFVCQNACLIPLVRANEGCLALTSQTTLYLRLLWDVFQKAHQRLIHTRRTEHRRWQSELLLCSCD